ncbi:hypothetical protein ACKXKY_004901, partial [Escherichia coli]
ISYQGLVRTFLNISLGIWGCFFLIFGETIITAPFAVYFLYRKDQHALVVFLTSKKRASEVIISLFG